MAKRRDGELDSAEELLGVSVRVWWQGEALWFEGTIDKTDWRRNRHIHHLNYADGDQQWHDLGRETWERLGRAVKLNGSRTYPPPERAAVASEPPASAADVHGRTPAPKPEKQPTQSERRRTSARESRPVEFFEAKPARASESTGAVAAGLVKRRGGGTSASHDGSGGVEEEEDDDDDGGAQDEAAEETTAADEVEVEREQEGEGGEEETMVQEGEVGEEGAADDAGATGEAGADEDDAAQDHVLGAAEIAGAAEASVGAQTAAATFVAAANAADATVVSMPPRKERPKRDRSATTTSVELPRPGAQLQSSQPRLRAAEVGREREQDRVALAPRPDNSRERPTTTAGRAMPTGAGQRKRESHVLASMESMASQQRRPPVLESNGLQLHLSHTSHTGYKGVFAEGTKYAVRVGGVGKNVNSGPGGRPGRKSLYLGRFSSMIEAAECYARHQLSLERAKDHRQRGPPQGGRLERGDDDADEYADDADADADEAEDGAEPVVLMGQQVQFADRVAQAEEEGRNAAQDLEARGSIRSPWALPSLGIREGDELPSRTMSRLVTSANLASMALLTQRSHEEVQRLTEGRGGSSRDHDDDDQQSPSLHERDEQPATSQQPAPWATPSEVAMTPVAQQLHPNKRLKAMGAFEALCEIGRAELPTPPDMGADDRQQRQRVQSMLSHDHSHHEEEDEEEGEEEEEEEFLDEDTPDEDADEDTPGAEAEAGAALGEAGQEGASHRGGQRTPRAAASALRELEAQEEREELMRHPAAAVLAVAAREGAARGMNTGAGLESQILALQKRKEAVDSAAALCLQQEQQARKERKLQQKAEGQLPEDDGMAGSLHGAVLPQVTKLDTKLAAPRRTYTVQNSSLPPQHEYYAQQIAARQAKGEWPPRRDPQAHSSNAAIPNAIYAIGPSGEQVCYGAVPTGAQSVVMPQQNGQMMLQQPQQMMMVQQQTGQMMMVQQPQQMMMVQQQTSQMMMVQQPQQIFMSAQQPGGGGQPSQQQPQHPQHPQHPQQPHQYAASGAYTLGQAYVLSPVHVPQKCNAEAMWQQQQAAMTQNQKEAPSPGTPSLHQLQQGSPHQGSLQQLQQGSPQPLQQLQRQQLQQLQLQQLKQLQRSRTEDVAAAHFASDSPSNSPGQSGGATLPVSCGPASLMPFSDDVEDAQGTIDAARGVVAAAAQGAVLDEQDGDEEPSGQQPFMAIPGHASSSGSHHHDCGEA